MGLLVTMWAFAYLPGLSIRDLRLEEGRRAIPAWEMLHTGNYVVPKLFGETYLSKPPLYFWLVAGVRQLLGNGNDEAVAWALAVRLPSALGTLAGALLVLAFARKSVGWESRVVAAFAVLSCVVTLDKGTLGEIDGLLTSLVIATVVVWYGALDSNPTGPVTTKAWIGSALVMSVAVLLKGPGGPLEFYCMVIPYVIWQRGVRGLREFLSVGHLLFCIIATAPFAGWVLALMERDGLALSQFLRIWEHQIALDEVPGLAKTIGVTSSVHLDWRRYGTFLPGVLVMTLPWSLVAGGAAIPWVAGRCGILRRETDKRVRTMRRLSVWRLTVSALLFTTTIFWIYPGALLRHMMFVVFPVSVLAAMLIGAPRVRRWVARNWRPSPNLAILVCAPAVLSVVALVLAATTVRSAWVMAEVSFSFAISFGWIVLARATRIQRGAAANALALAFAVALLIGFGVIGLTFRAVKAPTDAARIAHLQIEKLVPKGTPLYTTRTFASGHGNNYYNDLFYGNLQSSLTGGVHALTQFDDLPARAGGRRVTVLIAQDEVAAAQSFAQGNAEIVGKAGSDTTNVQPLVVVSVQVPSVRAP